MAAPVRIEARAWGDPRFRTLARLTGLDDPDFAIIKVARIWSWQTERYGEDPNAYVVDRDTVESILGPNGWDALIRSKLADETPGGLRMRGTTGQIEWCADLSSKRQHAGRNRAAKAKRDAAGRMVGEPDDSNPAHAGGAGPAQAPAPSSTDQQATSTEPAKSSALTLTPTPTHKEEITPRKARVVFQPAVVAFDAYYRRTHPGSAPTWNDTTGAMMKRLVQSLGLEHVLARIAFLEATPPDFPPGPWDLKTFVANADRCVPTARANQRAGPRIVATSHEADLSYRPDTA